MHKSESHSRPGIASLRGTAGWVVLAVLLGGAAFPQCARGGEELAVSLPHGVRPVWDSTMAFRQTTSTRERICLNGLWQWQPAEAIAEEVPAENWGWFKVPGSWPGITDYMQKDSQTVFAHPKWKETNLASLSAAWHRRTFSVPNGWASRRVTIECEYLNSLAVVYLDGQRVGELYFPGGELDITTSCRPGATHTLSMLVTALPLKGVMLSYTDSASAREINGSVARRGLCGDVYLVSAPRGPRISDARAVTSVRNKEITFDAGLQGLEAARSYSLRARVTRAGSEAKVFESPAFLSSDVTDGRKAFVEKWMPDQLWDIHTPQNICGLEVSLLDHRGNVLDVTWPERFGFREFWIEGRDFFLNGTRLFLSAVPLDNAQVSAGMATYQAARESMERLRSFGINFVYTHNYGCEPGSHLGFAEILRAADDAGMLVSFSQPHFSHYDWQAPDADRGNSYARHAEFYVRAAQNHPAVVMYSMSHNATGYNDDMNPDMIDGIHDARDNWSSRNARQALRAEDIVRRLDPSRIVYHHASGNLGSMHSINFYPNFAPVQELSDWFEHWAVEGVKPVFTCEYGAPFSWDWTMYRGWFNGKREFGSAAVPWEFCLAEWNGQFFGDRAFQISEPEKANLRWEAKQFRAGKVWHRWDYPFDVGSTRFEERYPVFAMYLTDNWRAFRTWGVSANSPWEHGHFWKLREGVDKGRRDLPVDWANLQRPGFSPDYTEQRYERMDLAFDRSDWIPTVAALSLIRNNRPLLAWIGGKPARFTSKDHIFLPGETVEKQIIVINNSRESVTCETRWSFDLPGASGRAPASVAAGQQERIPVRFRLPSTAAPGTYELEATVEFSTGETQQDRFSIEVLPAAQAIEASLKIALFDPRGETRALLETLGVRSEPVAADAELAAYDLLIVGKAALTPEGPAPDITRVRQGLKVIVFEQASDVLERRFGFRVQEYGLRQVFPRIPDHPILANLDAERLRDWRGEAAILAPRIKLESHPRFNGAPTVNWCGLPVTRLWRCGNRGNVASVLIEKPARGDFLPVVDGGFSLQYSPLMEYREGEGVVLFCQMDVTGRTDREPAANMLAANLLRYVSSWKPGPRRTAVYVGEPGGQRHFQTAGVAVKSFDGQTLSAVDVLIAGPGSRIALAGHESAISKWLQSGGSLLGFGLGEDEVRAFSPEPIGLRKAEHIAAYFEPPAMDSSFAGIGPADVHNRDPRDLPLVSSGAHVLGNGVLARGGNARLVLCQLVPWRFNHADQPQTANLRRTHRRVSFLASRLLANLGVAGSTPLLDRFHRPLTSVESEKRWLDGLYLDQPEEWDDPYRFFRW